LHNKRRKAVAQRLAVKIGQVALKNPVICGAGEATMSEEGIRAALKADAGAVLAKSINEAQAGKRQLDHTDYMLLDSRWRPIEWTSTPPEDAQLFCRSGLQQDDFNVWLEKLVRLDAEAKALNSYVVGNLIVADLERCVRLAEQMQEAGLRVLMINIGPPHAEQAVKGSITLERSPDGVRDVIRAVRARIRIPIWVKLTGQTADVSLLAKAAMDAGADAADFIDRPLAMVPDLKTRSPFLGTMAGIGGPWSLGLTCRWLATTRRLLGAKFPLIGNNGARDGFDVARMMLAGATAVELTTAVQVGGSRVIRRSIDELDGYLTEQGITAVQLIGEAADKLKGYTDMPVRPGVWTKFISPDAVPANLGQHVK
jgi:dihydroorotate dehydrogenase